MSTSEILQRHVAEHNAQVQATQDRIAANRALRAEIQAGFEQHERNLKAFHRDILARVDAMIAVHEREAASIGPAIDTLESPSATLLDMTGMLRQRAAE